MQTPLVHGVRTVLITALALTLAAPAHARKGKHPELTQTDILAKMDVAAKRLKTVSAKLEYTNFTALVNDNSTQKGELYYRKGKDNKLPEILVDFKDPDQKKVRLYKGVGEMYLVKANEVQVFNVSQNGDVLQQFLLLGFGTEGSKLKKDYEIKYVGEEPLGDETTALLELTPKANAPAGITKIQLWISEDSWVPTQQKFFKGGGDYTIAHYSGMQLKDALPDSAFNLGAPDSAKRVKMN
jgi:outer membrane lipoprotein-sorting protein